MFGGAGVYADGVMFALVADGEAFLRADDDLAGRLAAEGSRPFVHKRGGRPVTMGYWRLPDAALDDPEAAGAWARAALAVARRAGAARR
jgi:DNA transformation protein